MSPKNHSKSDSFSQFYLILLSLTMHILHDVEISSYSSSCIGVQVKVV